MKRVAVVSSLLMLACTSREATDGAAQPSVRSEPGATAWTWRASEAEVANAGYLLGVVGQAGTPHCPEGTFDPQWLGIHPTVGRVGVSGPADSVFDPLMGQPVLAMGWPKPAPGRAVDQPVLPCPPPQMRSDWRQTPRGMVIERDPAPSIAHFEVAAVRSLHELTARREGSQVVVTLQNPVPIALSGVELRILYEGCFGKPGTMTETTEIGELGVGAVAAAHAPQLATDPDGRPGRQSFRADSIQLVATGEGVAIDLLVSLYDLDASVDCPEP